MLETVVVLHDQKRKAIHFTETKLQGDDIWWPYNDESIALSTALGQIMVLNKVARKLVSVNRIRRCGVTEEFEVAYNAAT